MMNGNENAGRDSIDAYEQKHGTEPDVEEMHAVVYREKMEPREGTQPIPIWLILASFTLLMWGGWYLGSFSADFAVDRYDGTDAYDSLSVSDTKERQTQIDPILLGKRVYNNCIACHQADGQGVANQFPPLRGSEVVNGREDILARILLHGMTGPIEVLGKQYNGAMPQWGHLNDQSLAAVLTYIRASWGNESPAVSEDLIKTVREATTSRQREWTMPELEDSPEITGSETRQEFRPD